MNYTKIKPKRWVYLLAALPLILGCILIKMIDYQSITNFPSTVKERYNLDNLTQVVVPSSVDISFANPGAYGVYYEYHSVVNGVKYDTGKGPPALECNLTSKKSGTKVNAVPDFVESNVYHTKDQERIGVLIMSITIPDPGIYSFFCQYSNGKTRPDIVVAVGPNFVWEFFKISAVIGRSICSGIAVIFFAVLVSIIVAVIITIMRNQSRKRLEV